MGPATTALWQSTSWSPWMFVILWSGCFCHSRNQRKNSNRSLMNRIKVRNEMAMNSKNTITSNYAFLNQYKKYSFPRTDPICYELPELMEKLGIKKLIINSGKNPIPKILELP